DGEAYVLGETIKYEIIVTNDGNLTISEIKLTDTVAGYDPVDISASLENTELKPGEAATVIYEHVVNEQDIMAGTVKNEAAATGVNPSEEETQDDPDDTEDEVGQEYTLTIRYRYQDGRVAAADHVERVKYGENYEVTSPYFNGYVASQPTVSGTMPMEDVTVTVIYVARQTPIIIPDIETPLGIGVGINVGETIE
ncbi:MAG: MucBP domain-containing protein, partial [Clostridia bacterium]|nr:MucBP domain-containing protein [Clostridia bacterium]